MSNIWQMNPQRKRLINDSEKEKWNKCLPVIHTYGMNPKKSYFINEVRGMEVK